MIIRCIKKERERNINCNDGKRYAKTIVTNSHFLHTLQHYFQKRTFLNRLTYIHGCENTKTHILFLSSPSDNARLNLVSVKSENSITPCKTHKIPDPSVGLSHPLPIISPHKNTDLEIY